LLVLLGDQAKGLSPIVFGRFKAHGAKGTRLGVKHPDESAMSWLRNCAPENVAELIPGQVYEDGIQEARSMHPQSIGGYLIQ
jgi:hypothetical protein